MSKTYTYALELNSKKEIIGGSWTGRSVTDHPDSLSLTLSSGPKTSFIDCDEVRRLARAKDDDLETPQNSAVPLTQGTYNLVLLDEDRYILEGRPGDSVYLEISKDDTSTEDVQLVISNLLGESVITDTLGYKESIGWTLELDNPPYTLSLTQENYATKPNIYSVSLTKMAAFRQQVPYIPKSGPWSGFVMVNAGPDTVKNVSLVSFDGSGKPVQTLLGPVDFVPSEKQTVIFDDLPWRSHEYGNSDSIILTADQPLVMLNLFAKNQDPMGGFVQDEARGRHLIIPGTVADITASGNLKGSVLNESFDPAVVTFRMYRPDGTQQDADVVETIGAGGKYFYTPGSQSFYHFPRQGWMDIMAGEGSVISAYQYAKHAGGKRNAIETLFALPVETNFLILPHVTPALGWWRTYLVLINPNDAVNPVNFHFAAAGADTTEDLDLDLEPFEKQVMDLSARYGNMSGAPARSVLEISANHPLAGYFTYSPPYGGDEAGFPLMTGDMFQSRLIMPHHAGQDDLSFWSGVCLCNPNAYSVTVTVRPHDTAGQVRGDLVETMTIGAGEKAISTVRSMFGAAAPDISFIVFEAADQSPIGGFYLFGNMIGWKMSVEMLAGANM